MSEADSNDIALIRRAGAWVVLLTFLVFAFWKLHLVYSQKFFDITGRAQWIWMPHQMSRDMPVAFFATREFPLPENRYYTKIKVIGDPEYTLYFNGQEIGGRRIGEQRAIDVYDVTKLARTFHNRIVISVRSTRGVGGLIAALDVSPEVENHIVTGSDWRIYRTWRPELISLDPPGLSWTPPMLLGRPPIGRWNYLRTGPGKAAQAIARVTQPLSAFRLQARMPFVKIASGVAVATVEPVRAIAYDFGPTEGRVRLTIDYDNGTTRLVNVRLTNIRDELFLPEWNVRPFVFAPGETTVLDQEAHKFRYVLVYGARARAEVVQ